MSEYNKRLIEYDIPLEEISEQSAREKSIRHGHISTLHIWWARRPLAACRAAIYASLVPKPESVRELKERKRLIKELVNWDNVKANSYNKRLIHKARSHVLEAFNGRKPKILDSFAGGGSIPLEALRLGCETYSMELNPVAVLILKGCLEFPQKFGRNLEPSQKKLHGKEKKEKYNLARDFEKWANWILREVGKEIVRYYPKGKETDIPVAYIWVRTIKCQNPSCGAEIPLLKDFWLAKKKNKKVALKPIVHKENKEIDFELVREKLDFDPSKGIVKRAVATCPVCGTSIAAEKMRELGNEDRMGEKLIATVYIKKDRCGKFYRLASSEDLAAFKDAEKALERRKKGDRGSLSLIPNEKIPMGIANSATRARHYGFSNYGKFFNARQLLVLTTFVEKIKETYERLYEETQDKEYAKALMTYLSMILGRLADYDSTLCLWHSSKELIAHTFGRQSLPMVWDFAEVNPFSGSTGDITGAIDWIKRVIQHCQKTPNIPADVRQGDASNLPYPDNYFDAVITDPPYYDNIQYAEISDFFYVWLKRAIRDLYPNLFSTPLTPKSKEIVQNRIRQGGTKEAKRFFEEKLTESFREINRVLKDEGITTVVFAHKSTSAWETMIRSLLEADLVVTASWPIHTEMSTRLRARGSAALASSVFFVCRKLEKEEEAYFEDIEGDIKDRIRKRLDYFWKVGIAGADFFVSAIGPAIEVFGQYENIKKYSGEQVSVLELLRFVEGYVAEYALNRILKTPPSMVDPEARFYLVWRWTYHNNKIPFDDARMLGQALGFGVSEHMGADKLIEKSGSDVKVRNPKERGKNFLERPFRKPASMIDVIHKGAIFWKSGKKDKLNKVLEDSGYLENERFWMVVQAISAVLPSGDPEKKMLQGLLAGRKRIERGPKITKVTDFMSGDAE